MRYEVTGYYHGEQVGKAIVEAGSKDEARLKGADEIGKTTSMLVAIPLDGEGHGT